MSEDCGGDLVTQDCGADLITQDCGADLTTQAGCPTSIVGAPATRVRNTVAEWGP
ncbi:hypothetical protein SAMN04487981_103332 [Streptomyces sp. cf386]|nr:hypothetical protein SAMN04487981_103332 [Streptomyces sp. cf386]